MTKDIFELLKKYEKHLQRARGNYLFGFFQEDYDVLFPIYQQLGGREHLRYSCVNCNIRLLQYIGKYYFDYTPQEEQKVEKVVEIVEPVQEKEPIEEKPKKHPGGRPKGSKSRSRVKK